MLIDHIVPSISPLAGGTTKSVLTMCNSLASIDGNVIRLITQLDRSRKISKLSSPLVQLSIANYSGTFSCRLGLDVKKQLDKNINYRRPDLIHSNGIWSLINHWSVSAAQRHKIPLICQPHGMLSPWALSYKRLKKYFALKMYQQRDICSASLLVATSEMEASQLRELGFKHPIAVVQNGIVTSKKLRDSSIYINKEQKFGRVLFLGRIHPMKGLLNLIEAWSKVSPDNWILQIAGPDEIGHLAEIFARAKRLGIQKHLQYLGFIEEEDKEAIYQQADVVVIPSFGENFSMVVAEALSFGKPVIATKTTPWADLELYECGWWVEPTIEEISKALRNVVTASPNKLIKMGISAEIYSRRYDSDFAAKRMCDVYRWVLGIGAKPKFCHLI